MGRLVEGAGAAAVRILAPVNGAAAQPTELHDTPISHSYLSVQLLFNLAITHVTNFPITEHK